MAINKLNKKIITEAVKKLPKSNRDIVLSDGQSLFLNLSKANPGLGYWFLIIRDPFTKKQKKINIGKFNLKLNEMSVDQARLKANDTRNNLNDGKVITKVNNKNVVTTEKITVEEVYEKYLQTKSNLKKNSKETYTSFINMLDKVDLLKFPIMDINLSLFVDRFNHYVVSGKIASLFGCANFINILRKYAAQLEIIPTCPNLNLGLKIQKNTVQYRASLLFEDLPEFFNNLRQSNLNTIKKVFICLIILTLCRKNEILSYSEDEVELNKEYGTIWRIPANKMKNKQEHLIYLHPLTEKALSFLYKNKKSLNLGLLAVLTKDIKNVFKKYDITLHGFRATGSTFLNSKFPEKKDITSMLLSHKFDQSEVEKRYNRFNYLPQKTELIIYWTEHLIKTTCIKEILEEII